MSELCIAVRSRVAEVSVRSHKVDIQGRPERVIVAVEQGPKGPAGPPGPAGDVGITHTQTEQAATWTIPHVLGRKPSSVTVWIDDELVDTTIETPDASTVVITFATPQSGRAEII